MSGGSVIPVFLTDSMKTLSLKNRYESEVVKELKEEFGFRNAALVPKVSKVTVNVGVGKIHKEDQQIQEVVNAITAITGQKPLTTVIKKAIAGFKVRENAPAGVKVTLRRKQMWDFLDRLVHGALPRTRDFQGIPETSVDQSGNLNIGIREHSIFPEIRAERVSRMFSLQVTVTTTAKDAKEGLTLFRALGFPIRKGKGDRI